MNITKSENTSDLIEAVKKAKSVHVYSPILGRMIKVSKRDMIESLKINTGKQFQLYQFDDGSLHIE